MIFDQTRLINKLSGRPGMGSLALFSHCEAKQAEAISMDLELHMNVLLDASHLLSHLQIFNCFLFYLNILEPLNIFVVS